MKYIISCFLIFLSGNLFAQKKYNKAVKVMLSNSGLSDKEALYLICINANDCVNCLLPIGDLIRQIGDKKIENVAYLIDGVTPSEKNRYAYAVLHLDTVNQKIIVNKSFYSLINPGTPSKIVVVQNGRNIYEKKIKELPDDSRLAGLLEKSTKRILLTDSLSLDAALLQGTFVSDLINDTTLITLNTRYQEIRTVNLKNKAKTNIVTNHTLGLNADSLLSLVLDSKADSVLLWFNIWLRHQETNFFTRNPLFPDIDLMNLAVQGKNMMLVVGIPLLRPSFRDNDTSYMITKIPFIVTLNSDLQVKKIFCFSTDDKLQPPPNYIAGLYVPFYFDEGNNTIYFKTYFEGDKEDFKTAKDIMVCRVKSDKICFERLLNFNYPEFFWQKGLYNDYNNCNFSHVADSIYYYFTFTPDIFNLSSGRQYSINNTAYEKSELKTVDKDKMDIQFKMQGVLATDKGYGVCYISGKRLASIVWLDQNWKEISINVLPMKNVLRAIVKEKQVFILCDSEQNQKTKLYKYDIN